MLHETDLHAKRTRGFWASQRDRISQWGVMRTLGYYVFAVGADKLNCRVLNTLEFAGRANSLPRSAAADFSIANSMADWTTRDFELLRASQGAARMEVYKGYFDHGNKCAIARLGGSELACMVWLKITSEYCSHPGQDCVVLTDAFTMPEHRGKGLYPQTLSFICDYALRVWGNAAKICADCSVVNYASKKGLLKAGFVSDGWIISISNHTWHWPGRCHQSESIDASHAQ